MLVDYWICERIINGGRTREEDIIQGYGMIGTLLEVCLLIDCDSGKKVKMHDVVRQMALWSASHFGKQEENFVVKTGCGLPQMPEVKDWNAVRRMSLENNEIQNISVTPDCSNLTTLILRHNKLVSISGDFFLSMPKLLVLDLSVNKNLRELPEEISMLVSLRYLNLAATNINKLPAGIRKLIQLRYLNLMAIESHPSISGISSLVNLETLYMDCSTFLSLALIEDIMSLKYLKVLSVSINNIFVLDFLSNIPELASCIERISLTEVEERKLSFEMFAGLRSISIEDCFFFHIMEDTRNISFQNLTFVKLTELRGIQDLTWLLFAPNLISLFVVGPSPQLTEIISHEKVSGILNEGSSMRPFENLQTLYLAGLVELKSIYGEPLVFPQLGVFVISQCPKLKKLPLNDASANKNDIRLWVDSQEWLDKVEWEDEATKDRFVRSSEIFRTNNAAAESS